MTRPSFVVALDPLAARHAPVRGTDMLVLSPLRGLEHPAGRSLRWEGMLCTRPAATA